MLPPNNAIDVPPPSKNKDAPGVGPVPHVAAQLPEKMFKASVHEIVAPLSIVDIPDTVLKAASVRVV